MPEIPELRRLRQTGCRELKDSLGYIVILSQHWLWSEILSQKQMRESILGLRDGIRVKRGCEVSNLILSEGSIAVKNTVTEKPFGEENTHSAHTSIIEGS